MKSVALTDSSFHVEDDFVVVSSDDVNLADGFLRISLDDPSLSTYHEESSYDYCDDIFSVPSIFASSHDEEEGLLPLPPNLTDTDVEEAVVEVSETIALDISEIKEDVHDTFQPVEQREERPSPNSTPCDDASDVEEAALDYYDRFELRPSALDAMSARSRRLSGKKRRKKMRLARKAMTAASAAAAMSHLSSSTQLMGTQMNVLPKCRPPASQRPVALANKAKKQNRRNAQLR